MGENLSPGGGGGDVDTPAPGLAGDATNKKFPEVLVEESSAVAPVNGIVVADSTAAPVAPAELSRTAVDEIATSVSTVEDTATAASTIVPPQPASDDITAGFSPDAVSTSITATTLSPPAEEGIVSIPTIAPATATIVDKNEVMSVDIAKSEFEQKVEHEKGSTDPTTATAPSSADLRPESATNRNAEGFRDPPNAPSDDVPSTLSTEVVVGPRTTPPPQSPPPALLQSTNKVLEFATPTQPSRDLRDIILAAQSATLFKQGSVPPSPIVEPGALHELGDIHAPDHRRSSAVGGIAGLEELRNRKESGGMGLDESSRFDQLIQATKLNDDDESSTHLVNAFLRLDFEDGNVYYIKNPSVLFGRAEGASAGYYSHVGPNGSTIIETGPAGFGTTTSSGLMSMKREKKKRKRKKEERGVMGKAKSSTSDSTAPGTSRRGSGFGQTVRVRDSFGPLAFMGSDEPVIHLPLTNSSVDSNPRKNISRRHARLFYNTPKRRFELEIMGKNGAFVDEEYVQAGSTIIVAKGGMKVQIGGISFSVIVPEIPGRNIDEEVPPPKHTGGKGKMSFLYDDNVDELEADFSGGYDDNDNDDVDMEDVQNSGTIGSEEEEDEQQSDEGGMDVDEDAEGDSGEEEDDEGGVEEFSDDSELSPPSPEPVPKRGRGKPWKTLPDLKKKERELQRDRDRIKELQRQLKEKEKEKAEAEAELVRREREREREEKREREQKREREKEKEREREREKIKVEKGKKKAAAAKAAEIERQKEARRQEKEMIRLAREKEKEKEREKKAKLHLPQPTKKEERKLYLPTPSKKPRTNNSDTVAPPSPLTPGLNLSQPTHPTNSSEEMQINPLPLPQHQQQQLDQMHHTPPIPPLSSSTEYLQSQNYAQNAALIDPALYDSSMTQFSQTLPDVLNHNVGVAEKPRKEKVFSRQKKIRTPSPEINEADLPPEALLKPNISYVVMIHEAILKSPDKALSLPQIYKAIETKYPYYKFKVTTNGWQSSVRHNLGQHKAFCKVDRAGKGWLWGVVDGVSIEKEKKGSAMKQMLSGGGYDVAGIQSPNGQGFAQTFGPSLGFTPGYASPHQQENYGMLNTNGQVSSTAHQQPVQAHPSHLRQVPPPPSYMPTKQPQQISHQPAHSQNSRVFEAPIPMPPAIQKPELKPDVHQLIALLTRVVAQRTAQNSADPSAKKSLEQIKGFLSQLSSGKTNPVALEAVANIVNSFKRGNNGPMSTGTVAPVPSLNAAIATLPASTISTAITSTPPAPGQVAGESPANPPKVTLANLHEHIKTMSAEERAQWTKKLLEIKQKNAAAAAAGGGQASAHLTAAGKAPVSSSPSENPTAGKSPVPAGKYPAGKMPSKAPPLQEALKSMSPEARQQYLGKLVATSQAMKRPFSNGDLGRSGGSPKGGDDGNGVVCDGEPPFKKVDLGEVK